MPARGGSQRRRGPPSSSSSAGSGGGGGGRDGLGRHGPQHHRQPPRGTGWSFKSNTMVKSKLLKWRLWVILLLVKVSALCPNLRLAILFIFFTQSVKSHFDL